jgi:hypothetical protein
MVANSVTERTFRWPGTIHEPAHSASPNAERSTTNTGMPSGLNPGRRGSWLPLAGLNLRYARNPAKNTTSAEETATASVTPVSKSRTGTSAVAGISAIESATE